MTNAELLDLIYAEKATISEEYERADDSTQLGLLEGWDKALSWVARQIMKGEVKA
jgi:hypothetical protein